MAELEQSTFDPTTERALRARILELEAVVEARTQAIVGLGAQLAEARGDGSPVLAERLREAERQLAELRGTKVLRYTARARRAYSMLRGTGGRAGLVTEDSGDTGGAAGTVKATADPIERGPDQAVVDSGTPERGLKADTHQ